MLELIIGLSWILHKYADAYIVGGLLALNALIGFLEEQKAAVWFEALENSFRSMPNAQRWVWSVVPPGNCSGDVLRIRAGISYRGPEVLNGDLAVDQSA